MLKTLFLAAMFSLSLLAIVPVKAADVIDICKEGTAANSQICKASEGDKKLFGPDSIWNNILNILTFAIGAVAVLMVIIGAMKYALSGGEQAQIASAKNTIIYAMVALIVAVMANALVNFVLTNI